MTRQPRRPKTRALVELYDEGWEAAHADEESPYGLSQQSGDGIRHHLWTQGYNDAENALAALV